MVDSVHLFALRARRVGSGHCVVYSVHLVYERTNEVKFNMRLRLRVSDSEKNFRQPPQNGVDNFEIVVSEVELGV